MLNVDIVQIDAFVAWLNPKGVRELALKNTITKWWSHIGPGIRKRQAVSSLFMYTVQSADRRFRISRRLSTPKLRRRPHLGVVLAKNTVALTFRGNHI